jgi:hypothetical protein
LPKEKKIISKFYYSELIATEKSFDESLMIKEELLLELSGNKELYQNLLKENKSKINIKKDLTFEFIEYSFAIILIVIKSLTFKKKREQSSLKKGILVLENLLSKTSNPKQILNIAFNLGVGEYFLENYLNSLKYLYEGLILADKLNNSKIKGLINEIFKTVESKCIEIAIEVSNQPNDTEDFFNEN